MGEDRFEERLRSALRHGAEHAPEPDRLAGHARQRLLRRRTKIATVAAAGVLAAIPVGQALTGTGSGSDAPPVASESPSATTTVDPGWRVESWHDLTFQVPAEWRYAGMTAWCVDGDTPDEVVPSVTRPEDPVLEVACSPVNGYGVSVGSSAAIRFAHESGHVWQYDADEADQAWYPDSAWISIWYDDETAITIVTPERSVTERILDSITRGG